MQNMVGVAIIYITAKEAVKFIIHTYIDFSFYSPKTFCHTELVIFQSCIISNHHPRVPHVALLPINQIYLTFSHIFLQYLQMSQMKCAVSPVTELISSIPEHLRFSEFYSRLKVLIPVFQNRYHISPNQGSWNYTQGRTQLKRGPRNNLLFVFWSVF